MTTKPDFYTGFTEPESAANVDFQPEYGSNYVIHTTRGHSFEMDDTPGRERIRLQHRSADDGTPGSFIEMHPNGDQVYKVMGDDYEIIVKDKNVLISGKCSVTIIGDTSVTIQGNKTEEIYGNLEQHIRGNFMQIVEGISTLTSKGDMRITAGSQIGSGLSISTGDYVYIGSDLQVEGECFATKLTAETRVDAGTGVGAGPLGFVSETGGLAIGLPGAVPGQVNVSGVAGTPGTINCTGTINAIISMNAPLGKFGTMTAILMQDTVNSGIFGSHMHPSPHGTTGTPMSKFV